MKYEIAVIGGGPAGLAAAIEAKKNGAERILVIERDRELGGILQQCIHNGFGLHLFNEELTGPEYAERFIDELKSEGIDYKIDTMVLEVTKEKIVRCINTMDGYFEVESSAVILAMGCRERTRGAIAIPGTRPSGIFTAGAAQRYINMEGYMVGKKVVILGSGDIGLIMARRMTLEGAKVLAVAELMPFSGGLTRNIVQCLDDYNIPLYLSHTVTEIAGRDRVKSVTIAKVDEFLKPIAGTEIKYECDTLLLSVGLIPENELSKEIGIEIDRRTNGPLVNESMETTVSGIFACGNVVHVHDLVDFVSEESRRAGKSAAMYVKGEKKNGEIVMTMPGNGISYIVPQQLRFSENINDLKLFMRVNQVFHKSKLIVKNGSGDIITEIKKNHMAPGEMESIKIPVNKLRGINLDSINVEVFGGEA